MGECVDDATLCLWSVAQTGGGVLGRWCCDGGICMVGIALCLGTVIQSGGGAFGLAGITKDGFGVWLQVVGDGAAPVPGAWALFGCATAGDCQGGHGWLGGKMMGVVLRGADLGLLCACCSSARRHATRWCMRVHHM